MTPMELARISDTLAKVRIIAEDFLKVFYNHLVAEAPEFRVNYLSSICDGGANLCVAIQRLADVANDPEAFQNALATSRVVSGERARRVHELSHRAFLWTAERCFGAEFTAEDRTAFEALHHAIMRALDRLHGASEPERSDALKESRIGWPASLSFPATR